ncbi:MAG: M24 family metallopeptidase [Spirochaetaceae bacterium]|jgi:Xaa-Pro aminopeptidase|nr:M24 family metallopeptidase [Spirochaetaceae bacterium]
MKLELKELQTRRGKFIEAMNRAFPQWDAALFCDTANQYYFAGTIQDALCFLFKDGRCLYAVRRSADRAKMESPLPPEELLPIASYRDIAAHLSSGKESAPLGNLYIEADTMSIAAMERLKKYFSISKIGYLDGVIRNVRGVKSEYELYWTRRCGELHRILLEERVPALLREGITEAEFMGELCRELYALGYQGLTRFHGVQTEISVGQIGFGTNSIYPTRFDGPGGTKGYGPAVPLSACTKTKLKKGDIVFVDTPFGIEGYHTDKTQVYVFGGEPPEEFLRAHKLCMEIEQYAASRLKPGEIPSKIYEEALALPQARALQCFMGVDSRHIVKFLGHGVGLNIDDFPVLAKGFDAPLEANMVLALEPKCGIAGIGMAGVEDTYIVTPQGGECVTGGGREIIRV